MKKSLNKSNMKLRQQIEKALYFSSAAKYFKVDKSSELHKNFENSVEQILKLINEQLCINQQK